MAQIDAYLDRMAQTQASRAKFYEDEPLHIRHPNGGYDGNVISNLQLRAFLREMLTSELISALETDRQIQFDYQAPAGTFDVSVRYIGNQLQMEVVPVQYSGTIGPMEADNFTAVNDSGQGAASKLPRELRGFSVGAFMLTWIWGIGNQVWIALLALVPCIGIIVPFYLGFKGNELAWKSRRWDSIDSFRRTQTGWNIAGICILVLSIPLGLLSLAVFFPVFARARENARTVACQYNIKVLATAANKYYSVNGHYPAGVTMAEWKPLLQPYVTDQNAFVCPSVNNYESYQINPDLAGATAPSPQTWLIMDTQNRHISHGGYGANVVTVDGEAHFARANE